MMPTLKERLLKGVPKEYRINNTNYYPQQYHWIDFLYVSDALKSSVELHPETDTKPEGLWLSGNEGWAKCKNKDSKLYVTGLNPLKAFISQNANICELGSKKEFGFLCNKFDVKVPESKNEVFNYNDFFSKIKNKYDGIHLSHRGLRETEDVFNSWSVDSTVMFNLKFLSFDLLNFDEIEILGWEYVGIYEKILKKNQ